MEESAREAAILAAKRILSHSRNTEGMLRDKMERQGCDAESIDMAIAYAKEHKYICDEEYIERQIEHFANEKLYGPSRIPVELSRRGFSRNLISDVDFDGIYKDKNFRGIPIDFTQNCVKLLRKKKIEPVDGRLSDRAKAMLARNGYPPSIISEAEKLILN